MSILVTGGAGFIGSALCRLLASDPANRVVNLDTLTYAGNLDNLRSIESNGNYRFVRADIGDEALVHDLLREERVEQVIHLAAESHVDRSIDSPESFIQTNIVGTFRLLKASLKYWHGLSAEGRAKFSFHHVSTDEVFGQLPLGEGLFTEDTPYAPSSPYSASKAAADHLVRAWHHTYGLPVVISNCPNNYGPYQFPEKLIPLTILNALDEREIPVYGSGSNVRDWLHVEDHARALALISAKGRVGETYAVGARAERSNIAIVQTICALLDQRRPRKNGARYGDLIRFVADRPGHDTRYAVDPAKITRELGWTPLVDFETGLANTLDWYLANRWWWAPIREQNYAGQRLGMAGGSQ